MTRLIPIRMRALARNRAVLFALSLMLLAMAGCAASSDAAPTPTLGPATLDAPKVPTDTPSVPSAPTPDASVQIWLEQPFGQTDTLAVLFYTAPDGTPCVRFAVSVPDASPVSACRESSRVAVVAAQGQQRTSQGEWFTLLVGRVLDAKVRVVAFELADGPPLAPEVDAGGVIAIVPGQHRAIRAVPIDEFGNTVGQIVQFR